MKLSIAFSRDARALSGSFPNNHRVFRFVSNLPSLSKNIVSQKGGTNHRSHSALRNPPPAKKVLPLHPHTVSKNFLHNPPPPHSPRIHQLATPLSSNKNAQIQTRQNGAPLPNDQKGQRTIPETVRQHPRLHPAIRVHLRLRRRQHAQHISQRRTGAVGG